MWIMDRRIPPSIRTAGVAFVPITLAALAWSCASRDTDSAVPVTQAWARNPNPGSTADSPTASAEPVQHESAVRRENAPSAGAAIAVVNGKPIDRQRVLELLLRGHGVGILEQIVVHDEALRVAEEKALTVSRQDVMLERDQSLARLVGVRNASELSNEQRAQAEGLLREVLARQNISEREFEMGLERNAALRKVVAHEMHPSDADLLAEFERTYGERVEIRHIQVRSPRDADEIVDRLSAGADFADLARTHSADATTARGGGLLPVFSRNDQNVPAVLREAAFKLEPGATSKPIRVRHDLGAGEPLASDEWLHIIRVERTLPASAADWQSLRPELQQRLADRLVEPAMQELHRALFQQAKIEIIDPVLREEFQRKHGRTAVGD
jgi:parvulin-like peptidyl-prolyl isomerase